MKKQVLSFGVVGVMMIFGVTVGCPQGKTVAQRVEEFGPSVATRLRPVFAARKVSYSPTRLALVGLKTERESELYAATGTNTWRFIKVYPIRAASGTIGPKLREGDGQVPEGIYRIESLNPNSRYHLSLRVNYPNEFDRARARLEKRTNLGGDIMIHGGAASIGCLAMGDEAAEELFVLAALTGIRNITVVLSPVDFRQRNLDLSPEGMAALYLEIKNQLEVLSKDE